MRPRSFFLTIVLRVAFLIGCLIATSSVSAQLLEIDRAALVALYNVTDGENWTNNTNWLSNSPLDTWYGVEVSIIRRWMGDRVTSLNLSENNLHGEIPVELTRLSDLEHLDLGDNALTGRIPYNLGATGRIKTFRISNNPELFGTLSDGIVRNYRLEVLWFDGTNICEPSDSDFQTWINKRDDVRRTGCIVTSNEYKVIGSCEPALAERFLNANNVQARILNNGNLFYRGEPHIYRVPRFSNSNAIFAASIWVGGLIEGQLHVAATRYGPYEFWPGPLDDDGRPPDDCSKYDRIYKVNRQDIEEYELTGLAVGDMANWPTGLGAPTVNSNGIRIDMMHLPLAERKDRVIDLEAGERPEILGDQALWWVMNDRGNTHDATDSPSLGIEVHGFAYAMSSSAAALNDATLYRYRIFNRNNQAIERTYFGVFFDPDLGDAGDDYVGTDTLRAIAYVYNADNSDISGEGYGDAPPAVGFRILRGPIADDDGFDNDRDGLIDEAGERMRMSHTHYYNGGGGVTEDPQTGLDYYRYMQSIWKNGQPVLFGGNAFDQDITSEPTNYFYPGDPVKSEYWSEMNPSNSGWPNPSADRRFIVSNGPFDLAPGQSKEIDFAVVYGRGKDHLDSITKMRRASDGVQAVFDSGFRGYPPGLRLKETVRLLSPSGGVTNQPTSLTLVWDKVTGVEGYQVVIASELSDEEFDTTTNSLTLTTLDLNRLYFWRVHGVAATGNGPWSEWRSFITGRSIFHSAPLNVSVVGNATGKVDPPDLGLFAFPGSGIPERPCPLSPIIFCSSPTRGYQQASNQSIWVVSAGTSTGTRVNLGNATYSSIVSAMTDRGALNSETGDSDYEWRWVGRGKGGLGYDFNLGNGMIDVSFELWDIGVGTPDDPTDDFRMIPFVDLWSGGDHDAPGNVFNIGGDHRGYGGSDDPYTNYVTWHKPIDTSPGQSGYEQFVSTLTGEGAEVFRKTVLVQIDGGEAPPYDVEFPEPGTVFRITHGEPLRPILAAPGNESQLLPESVRFYWTGLGTSYVFQISEQPDFSRTLVNISGVAPGISWSAKPKKQYFWRVFSDSSGWSEAWTFSTLEKSRAENDDRRLIEVGNYPNPFGYTTTIKFYLRDGSRVQLEIRDILGRVVMTAINEWRELGPHSIPVDAGRLSSGLYFYTLRAGDYVVTKTMIVAR